MYRRLQREYKELSTSLRPERIPNSNRRIHPANDHRWIPLARYAIAILFGSRPENAESDNPSAETPNKSILVKKIHAEQIRIAGYIRSLRIRSHFELKKGRIKLFDEARQREREISNGSFGRKLEFQTPTADLQMIGQE
jgi:hypothetical protein